MIMMGESIRKIWVNLPDAGAILTSAAFLFVSGSVGLLNVSHITSMPAESTYGFFLPKCNKILLVSTSKICSWSIYNCTVQAGFSLTWLDT